jgi:hypothetical protein
MNYIYNCFRFKTNYGPIEDESERIPLPEEDEIFKNGSNFVNFVHLYIVIGNRFSTMSGLLIIITM